jgi:Kdo2-lipid IVA lauroyltransferase/acyltransferase
MFLLRLISRLPFWTLYLFADFLFIVSYRLIGYRKSIVIRNLERSFPEKTHEERRKIKKAFYLNLCDYGVETLKLLTITDKELKRRMIYKNPEVVNKYADKNQPILIFASHQFNWEWLLAAGSLNLPMQIDFVYQQQHSELFNDFSLRSRSRFGAYGIRRQNVAREVIKRKDILRAIAIVADQFPGHENDKRYWTEFLNQETAFFQSINQMATLTQYPAFYAAIRKVKRGYYELELVEIAQPPYDKENFHVIENYIKATEKVIRQYPDGWLWSHNRWKNRR